MPALSILSLVWGNEWARVVVVAVLAAGFGWVKGWSAYPRVDVAALERNVIAGRDGYWQNQIAEANQAHEENLAAAVEAARAVVATPADLASRMQLCRAPGSHCRESGRR